MSTRDDGTLSLFGDEPFPAATPAPAPETKKPRAKRSAPTPAAELTHTEPVTLASDPEPQPRRNSPWAAALTPPRPTAHKPHVMLVITKGEAGDAQSHVQALCEALHTRVNFTVVIGGPPEDSMLGEQLQALGVRVCPMPAMVESMLPWRLWPAVQQLIALIEANPPDLIDAHSAMAGLAARLACPRRALALVYTVHGFGLKAELPWLRRHLASLAERALSGWATQMICVSAFERALAHQLPIAPERVHVIANGIARLSTANTASEAMPPATPSLGEPEHLLPSAHESALPNTTTPPRLIMVARMKSPKRHDLLLRALAKVRDWLGHELPVTLAGDGPLLSKHQALAQQLGLAHITWAGDVSHVAELLTQHDVFVLLSDHKGMPITVLEAMRAGLPVLASDLPGLREQVMHGHEGLLVANTEQAVAHQLLRLAQDPALRQRLGHAAQQRFEAQFTLGDMAERVMAVYQQCVREDFATSRPSTPLGSVLVRAYAAATPWQRWGYRRRVGQRALHLVHLDATVPTQLAQCLQPQALDPRAITLQAWHVGATVALPACDGVVVDRHLPHTSERIRLLSQLKMQQLRLYSVEAVAELVSGRKMLPAAADALWEIDNNPSYDRLKRWIDLSLVLLLAPLWLPLALGVAIAVRYDSAGPALYSQTRIGRYGQAFKLWKFRSMRHGTSSPTTRFAQADDPRITRVGQFIRRTRLDELPQLWNVLWGQMSLIGPRPEQAPFVRDLATSIPSYPYRHLVRPGLTGWAQVQQGDADSTRVKLSYDLYYVAHYSLALDLLIAVKTVRTVRTGFGAR